MVCSRTWYIYQHFLFDFPFDEIYRRLLFFTLGRMYQIRICVWYVRYVPDTYVPGISRQKSIRTYVMFRSWTHTSDLGPKEACTGLTFVCLSRAKRLVDLMVEPIMLWYGLWKPVVTSKQVVGPSSYCLDGVSYSAQWWDVGLPFKCHHDSGK